MRAAYWTGASTVGLREQDSDVFESRDDHSNKREVPIPMVALVGCAVRLLQTSNTIVAYSSRLQIHASLSEWKTGYHKKSFFSADAFLDAYIEHNTILNGILGNNAPGYHFMMHTLFSEAR